MHGRFGKIKWITILLAVGVAGYWMGARDRAPHGAYTPDAEKGASTYTCSMHPQIRQPEPGLCPLCAMDLIPVVENSAAPVGPRAVYLSAAARELARIETSAVVRGDATDTFRLSGTLAYDTSRRRDVVLLADGHIRVLHARVSGQHVQAGDPLAEVYSPDVLAAMREASIGGSGSAISTAARNKLRLLGVDDADIEDSVHKKGAHETYTVRSPVSGVVLSVGGYQGQWLNRGERLLELADLSVIWAEFDVYEHFLLHVREGLTVEISVEAFPGETWAGTLSFIPPEVNASTRSVRARVDMANADGRLKPGMFVRARMTYPVARDALLVPASAVLRTGPRAMVFVQDPDDMSVFEGRVVILGPRAGEQYVVREGLAEGERVASRGAMRIDSSLQLLAKPSMMSQPSEGREGHRPQTLCPIGGSEIDRHDFVDVQGWRVYFCCPGCDEEFLRDPDRHLSRMRAEGIELERAPQRGGAHEHH